MRHFSSLYALAKVTKYSSDEKMFSEVEKGLDWGTENLTSKTDGYFLIKDYLNTEIEYRPGAQIIVILTLSKYIEQTGDEQYVPVLNRPTEIVSAKFLTNEHRMTHVFDVQLETKERSRIIYYDGEVLFSLLRAYEILGNKEILAICQGLIDQSAANDYRKHHDHWPNYATNEMLKHSQTEEYYRFDIRNALDNIDFIDRRGTAYPTMLELLAAASKVMRKLEFNTWRKAIFAEETSFYKVKERINTVIKKRMRYEITTGVMFPEFAQFFKEPETIKCGFFACHDRFHMRTNDIEHFLSGLINC